MFVWLLFASACRSDQRFDRFDEFGCFAFEDAAVENDCDAATSVVPDIHELVFVAITFGTNSTAPSVPSTVSTLIAAIEDS